MGRYKALTGEFADLMLGYYGEDDRRARSGSGQGGAKAQPRKQPITGRPADLLKPEWEELRKQALALDGCNGSDEDVLTYAMFPQVAPKFFASRAEGPKNLSKSRRARPKPRPPATARPRVQSRGIQGQDWGQVPQRGRRACVDRHERVSRSQPAMTS